MSTTTDVREVAKAAREIAVDVSQELPETLRSADAWLRETAARQPLLALGAALAAGYAVGRLLARR
jgi:hypothetical protein